MLPANTIHFQIEQVKSRTKNTNKAFDTNSELESLSSNDTSISGHVREKQVGGKAVTSRNRKNKLKRPTIIHKIFETNSSFHVK